MTAQTTLNGQLAIKDYRSNSLWRLTLRRIFKQRSAIVGMVLLGFILLVALFAPLLTPYEPQQVLIGLENVTRRDVPCIHLLGCPSDQPQHLMGIDGNVRDEFTRVIFGTRISLYVGFSTVGVAIIIGTLLGAIAGYASG